MTGTCSRHPGAAIVTYLIAHDEDPDVAIWCEACDKDAALEESGAYGDPEPYFPVNDGPPGDAWDCDLCEDRRTIVTSDCNAVDGDQCCGFCPDETIPCPACQRGAAA